MLEAERRWVRDLLPLACQRLSHFSMGLRHPTEIRLHANRRDFRRATQKRAKWLRAWAGYRVIHILSPRQWQMDTRDIRIARLAHELAHVALFQGFASEAQAQKKAVPIWFSEGMASVIAEQGNRRMPMNEVCRRAADKNPLVERALWRRNHHILYGAAHAAVATLVERRGKSVISRVVKTHAASEQVRFAQTLQKVSGLDANGLWRSLCNAGETSPRRR